MQTYRIRFFPFFPSNQGAAPIGMSVLRMRWNNFDQNVCPVLLFFPTRFCARRSCMLQADSEKLRQAWIQAVQASIASAYRESPDSYYIEVSGDSQEMSIIVSLSFVDQAKPCLQSWAMGKAGL